MSTFSFCCIFLELFSHLAAFCAACRASLYICTASFLFLDAFPTLDAPSYIMEILHIMTTTATSCLPLLAATHRRSTMLPRKVREKNGEEISCPRLSSPLFSSIVRMIRSPAAFTTIVCHTCRFSSVLWLSSVVSQSSRSSPRHHAVQDGVSRNHR